jgi:hypothetical protein
MDSCKSLIYSARAYIVGKWNTTAAIACFTIARDATAELVTARNAYKRGNYLFMVAIKLHVVIFMSGILTTVEEYINTPPPPSFVQFETSTDCNAKCTFCPRSEMKRHGRAKWSTLRRIMCELIPNAEFVAPFLLQEPFLEPRLVSILANIKHINSKSKTIVYSNMGSVEREKIEEIVDIICWMSYILAFTVLTKESTIGYSLHLIGKKQKKTSKQLSISGRNTVERNH